MSPISASFPEARPGFWRRIELWPAAGTIVGGLEDDVHRFVVRLRHANGAITGVDTREERFPWSACPGAGPFLAEQLTGKRLTEVAALDGHIHCTHLFELALLCAAHADRSDAVRYDLKVADRVEDRTAALLEQDGSPALLWLIEGTTIAGPGEWANRDLRRLSAWKDELPADLALKAMMLRRAVMVSGARRQPAVMQEAGASLDPRRIGACFRYQLPRARDAIQTRDWRKDFSSSLEGPLQDFRPAELFEGIE